VAKDFTDNIEPSKSAAEATTTIAARLIWANQYCFIGLGGDGSQVTYTVEVTNNGSRPRQTSSSQKRSRPG
jgi:hypothetical protein